MLETVLIVAAVGGALVLGGLAVAVRIAVSRPTALEGSLTSSSSGDPGLRLELRPRRKVVVTGLSVPRVLAERMGLSAPAGFVEQPIALPPEWSCPVHRPRLPSPAMRIQKALH